MLDHENVRDKPRDIGLHAIREVRGQRARSKIGQITAKTWFVVLGSFAAGLFAAWLYRERSLESDKQALLAKQRAAVATVGVEWFPLRDAMEKIALDAAGPYKGDFVAPEAAASAFRTRRGIYLRARLDDAKDAASLRRAAIDSTRDSFAGCLLRKSDASAAAIARGEPEAGASWHDQPWNLRLAYDATRILGDDWANEVKGAIDEMHLRVFVQQHEKAEREQIPLAIDIVKQAEFFLLVLDEDVPEAQALVADGGPVTQEALQQVRHPARVHVLDLATGKEIVRLRREAEADFVFAGERAVRAPHVRAAMKRQVNNCALAKVVLDAIEPAGPKP